MDTFSILATGTVGFAGLHLIVPHFLKRELFRRFRRCYLRPDKVYLTFDDGPAEDTTPAILAVLKKYGVKATFFVLGERALLNPGLVDRIVREGHSIGNHGFEHKHAWKSLPWSAMFDMIRGFHLLRDETGHGRMWRPPYGKLNFLSVLSHVTMRLHLVYWTLDPKDYACRSAPELAEALIETVQLGHVVLLHDGRRDGTNDGCVTVEGLDRFLSATSLPRECFAAIDADSRCSEKYSGLPV